MRRTITYTIGEKTTTADVTSLVSSPPPEVDPVVARAMAEIAANDATAAYEKAAEAAAEAPDDERLQQEMQRLYTDSMTACERARQLRQ